VEDVTRGLTIPAVLQLLGAPGPDSRGFISCPWHRPDRHPSCHVVKDQRGLKCFACGATGGILDLIVAMNFAKDRASAAKWLESLR
jgi:CHC2 zinc finger